MRRTTLNGSRHGFTLTELLVSLALIVFMMSIMATAFGAASQVVRDLRAANDLAERLRGVMTLLRNDLRNQHLDNTTRRLGDGTWVPTSPANKGFFRIYQVGRPTDIGTGADATSFMSSSSLQFTTKLTGLYPTDFFSTEVNSPLPTTPTTTPNPLLTTDTPTERERRYQSTSKVEYRSQWAEVAWWLVPQSGVATGRDLDPATPAAQAGAQQLYTLRRRQRLLWDGNPVPTMPWVTATDATTRQRHRDLSFANYSSQPGGGFHANTPATVGVPALRFGAQAIPADAVPPNFTAGSLPVTNPLYAGLPASLDPPFGNGTNVDDDVPDYVLADVLSMDVRVLLDDPRAGMPRPTTFVDLGDATVQAFRTGNPAFNPGGPPYDTTGKGLYVFDTWTRQQLGQFDYSARDSADPTNPDYVQRWERSGALSCVPLYRRGNVATGDVIRIRAIQVTLRLWDEKTGFSRQVSMIQEF